MRLHGVPINIVSYLDAGKGIILYFHFGQNLVEDITKGYTSSEIKGISSKGGLRVTIFSFVLTPTRTKKSR